MNYQRLRDFAERRSTLILAILIATILLGGLAYSLILGDQLRYLDEREYYGLAQNLAHRGAYCHDDGRPAIFRPPGYPMFLAAFTVLGAPIVLLRFLNFILLSFSLYLTYRLLKRQSNSVTALIGAFLILAYPVLFYSAGTLYPQILAALLFLLFISMLLREYLSRWIFMFCGLLLGFLILVIPTFIFTLLVFIAYFALFDRTVWKKGFGLTLIAAGLIVGLWTVRNYAVFHAFVLVSSNSGQNLLIGNSENTRPNAGLNVDLSVYDAEVQARGLNEIEKDRYYRHKALEWISENKAAALKLFVLKLLNYFNYRNEIYTAGEASPAKDLIMLLTYGPLLLLGLVRVMLIKLFALSRLERLLIILYVSNAFFSALFFTRIRFRLPYDFLLIILAALFLDKIFQKLLTANARP